MALDAANALKLLKRAMFLRVSAPPRAHTLVGIRKTGYFNREQHSSKRETKG